MTSREAVNMLFKESGMSQTEYAEKLGITRAALWDRLNTKRNKELVTNVMSEMVRALGYRVVLVKNGSKIYGEAYVLD